MTAFDDALFDTIADALADEGYWVADDALPNNLLSDLLAQFNRTQSQGFKAAGIGRQTDFQLQDTIRSDKIQWLEPNTETSAEFLRWMDSLREGLNRRLYLGLFDYESHFASYAVGAFYKKHLDAFRNTRTHGANRVLSTVLYLNEEWLPDDGGELLMYTEDSDHVIKEISPTFGRMVIFLSEKFPHEVLSAKRERKSIAGWYRVNQGVI
jgi:SM-20-related protein